MHVYRTVREQALMRLLQKKFLTCGGRIAVADLEREWHNIGLRLSDLHDAVADLILRGCWVESHSDDGRYVQLGADAVERMRGAAATVAELADSVMARALLFRAARRKRHGHPGHGRRAVDRVTR